MAPCEREYHVCCLHVFGMQDLKRRVGRFLLDIILAKHVAKESNDAKHDRDLPNYSLRIRHILSRANLTSKYTSYNSMSMFKHNSTSKLKAFIVTMGGNLTTMNYHPSSKTMRLFFVSLVPTLLSRMARLNATYLFNITPTTTQAMGTPHQTLHVFDCLFYPNLAPPPNTRSNRAPALASSSATHYNTGVIISKNVIFDELIFPYQLQTDDSPLPSSSDLSQQPSTFPSILADPTDFKITKSALPRFPLLASNKPLH
ncbi:hypothetical protein V2J09_011005 [Rumex salicifolius]